MCLLCVMYVAFSTDYYLNLHMCIFKWRKSIFIPLVMVFFLFLSSYLLHIGIVPPLLLCKIAFNISFFYVKFIKFLCRFEKKGILIYRSASLNGQIWKYIVPVSGAQNPGEHIRPSNPPRGKILRFWPWELGKLETCKWEYKLRDVLHFPSGRT